jgi:hypothetical protein
MDSISRGSKSGMRDDTTSSIFSQQMNRKNRMFSHQKKINVYFKTEAPPEE